MTSSGMSKSQEVNPWTSEVPTIVGHFPVQFQWPLRNKL